MRVQELIEKTVAGNENEGLTLEYYLTQKESTETKKMIYGIAVSKLETLGAENEVVDNISYEKDQVLELIQVLSRNTVTPISLVEVLDDLMTERFYS